MFSITTNALRIKKTKTQELSKKFFWRNCPRIFIYKAEILFYSKTRLGKGNPPRALFITSASGWKRIQVGRPLWYGLRARRRRKAAFTCLLTELRNQSDSCWWKIGVGPIHLCQFEPDGSFVDSCGESLSLLRISWSARRGIFICRRRRKCLHFRS